MLFIYLLLAVLVICTIILFIKIEKINSDTDKKTAKCARNIYSRIYALENQVDLLETEEIPLDIRRAKRSHIEKIDLFHEEFSRFRFVIRRVRLAFDDIYGFEHFAVLRDIAQKIVKEHINETDEEFEKFINAGNVELFVLKNYPQQYRK